MCDVRSVQTACVNVFYYAALESTVVLLLQCLEKVCVCVSDKNQLKVPDLNADSLLEIENSLS